MGLCGPDVPDPATGYVAGINTDLETLPARRIIEALALTGGRGTVNIPGRGGGNVPVDFTGLGEADYQRRYADQLTQELLDIQRQFGPQYVEQRLAELEASDPEGAAMRRNLWDTIQTSSETLTPRPGQEALRDSILAELNRGGELDPETQRRLSQQVLGSQVARGNYLGNAAATQEATAIAQAQEAQKASRHAQAMAFLTGGLDPAEAAYREQMQDISNIGAFLGGETPVAQFSQLSGAQTGAAPFYQSGPLPGVNPNAGWQGIQNQQGVYNANQYLQNNTVNPWVSGLSGALQGARIGMNWGAPAANNGISWASNAPANPGYYGPG